MSTEQHHSRDEFYLMFETDLGACGIAWCATGITRLQLPETSRAATEARLASPRRKAGNADPPSFVLETADVLGNYFAGRKTSLTSVPVELGHKPPGPARIYEVVRRIPWGETLSYGEVAQQAGIPGAARLVGQCMARNPVPVIIPCHRVLASGQGLGGFSAPGGRTTKQKLLTLEHAVALEKLPLFAKGGPGKDNA